MTDELVKGQRVETRTSGRPKPYKPRKACARRWAQQNKRHGSRRASTEPEIRGLLNLFRLAVVLHIAVLLILTRHIIIGIGFRRMLPTLGLSRRLHSAGGMLRPTEIHPGNLFFFSAPHVFHHFHVLGVFVPHDRSGKQVDRRRDQGRASA